MIMKKIYLALAPLALLAAAPVVAQIDPGARQWVVAEGTIQTDTGDILRYVAVRLNPDGSRSYRLAEGGEITLDAAYADGDIVNLLDGDFGH